MAKRVLSAMLSVILVATLALVSAPAASATPSVSRAKLKSVASKVEYETVGGSNYGHYKKTSPYNRQLNWTKDGCSVPTKLEIVTLGISPATFGLMKLYEHVFKSSCDRHDFGYRNYGKNTSTPGPHPKLDPTRARKNGIDSKFYSNMKVQCERDYGTFNPARYMCKGAAYGFYLAVKKKADKAFFG